MRRVWRIFLVIAALMVAGFLLSAVLVSTGHHTRTTTFTVETQPTHT